MKETDVVIIGAGPAGSVCGNLLKEAGVDCVLVDFQKFPRDKVCGGGLTPKAWHLLEEMMPDLKYAYNPIRQVRTLIDGKEVLVAELSEELRIVKRKDFDHMLLQRYLQKDGTFIQDAFSLFEELEDHIATWALYKSDRTGKGYDEAFDPNEKKAIDFMH